MWSLSAAFNSDWELKSKNTSYAGLFALDATLAMYFTSHDHLALYSELYKNSDASLISPHEPNSTKDSTVCDLPLAVL